MDKKIIINFMYNTGYQILTLLLPFITIPYVSRVFMPKEMGLYSSTYSMVQIFLIIGMFAVGSYGVKEIAANRDDKRKLTNKFNEIRYMQKITMTISLLVYLVIFVIINENENRLIYLVQSINLLAGLVDISWLFIGLEDFKKNVTRNVIVKIVSLSLIFILIKKSSDLYLYAFILSIAMVLGNLSMWIYIKSVIIKPFKKKHNLKNNLIMALGLLIPQIAYQIYTSFDRVVLGSVNSMEAVGMYDQSQKIVRMAVGIVTSLGIVMLPRITNMITNNMSKEKINKVLKESLNLTIFISIGCTFGIFAISKNFVPWFYSEKYLDVTLLLKMTSIICVLTAIGSFLSNQYAIPSGNKKAYIIPIVCAAVVNIVLTYVLGREFGAIGACISIVFTESVALSLRLFYLRRELNYRYLFSDLYKFIIAGIFMLLSIRAIDYIFEFNAYILTTLIEVIIGGSIYCLISLAFNKKYIIIVKKLIRK